MSTVSAEAFRALATKKASELRRVGARGVAVYDRKGSLLYSYMLGSVGEDLSPLVASLVNASSKCSRSLNAGPLHMTILECDGGTLVVKPSKNVILAALLRKGANLGLALIEVGNAAEEIDRAYSSLLTLSLDLDEVEEKVREIEESPFFKSLLEQLERRKSGQ